MLALALGIVLLSFVSEDAATISSSLSVLGGPLAWPLGFVSCFLGIWLGDLGLYSAARVMGKPVLGSRFVRRLTSEATVSAIGNEFARRGTVTLLASRFIPGTRLATYLAAGLFGMPAARFAFITAIAGLLWITAAFVLTKLLGAQITIWLSSFRHHSLSVIAVGLSVTAALLLWRKLAPLIRRWEFWPAWIFYLPVALHYVWLGIRHRSFTLPSAANPGIHTGGLIGESKCAILEELRRTSPEAAADAYLIDGGTPTDRLLSLHRICRTHAISLPFILKPDIGQRGNGVRLIRSMREALNYFQQVSASVIVQRYAPGPHEVGIFYYRFPKAERGRIFAITEKIFPELVGDGQHTVEQLIRGDARARLIADTYLNRFADRLDQVLARGEVLKLVETGNHAQGCIFRDGAHLWTRELEAVIDRISRGIDGFYIGRYDVRYAKDEELQRGENFQIVELNGASSETTNIYDGRNSLPSAYRTLFAQWRLVFAIGAANRARGASPCSLMTLWREWVNYSHAARSYPAAD